MWDIAWDLWEDRNAVNVTLRDGRELEALHERTRQEYSLGWTTLHRRSRRLFTIHTLEARLSHDAQTLQSWLLRVDNARYRAETDPVDLEAEQQEAQTQLARQLMQQQRHEAAQRALRVTANMKTLMATWLRGG